MAGEGPQQRRRHTQKLHVQGVADRIDLEQLAEALRPETLFRAAVAADLRDPAARPGAGAARQGKVESASRLSLRRNGSRLPRGADPT